MMKKIKLLLACLMFILSGMALQAQTISQSAASPDSLIGQIMASDSDTSQSLTYVIISGNEGGVFRLDPVTGVLYWHKKPKNITGEMKYPLVIQVTDNGIPPLSSRAVCTVLIHP